MIVNQLLNIFPVGTIGHKYIKIPDNIHISKSEKNSLPLNLYIKCKNIYLQKYNKTNNKNEKPNIPVSDNIWT